MKYPPQAHVYLAAIGLFWEVVENCEGGAWLKEKGTGGRFLGLILSLAPSHLSACVLHERVAFATCSCHHDPPSRQLIEFYVAFL
jgi:hypothetical protein